MTARGGCGRLGVTLIEVVVAVALSAVVAFLCAGVAVSVRRVLEARSARRSMQAVDFALRMWTADIESACWLDGCPGLRLEARAADSGLPRLHVLRWGEVGPAAHVGPSEEVIWRMSGREGDEGSWDRIVQARVGPRAATVPLTTRVVRGVMSVRLEATDGTNWWADWPPPQRSAVDTGATELPAGLRLTIVTSQGMPRTVTAAIRAAIEVRPAIERRAVVAPSP